MKFKNIFNILFFLSGFNSIAQTIDASIIGKWKVIIPDTSADYSKWEWYANNLPKTIIIDKNGNIKDANYSNTKAGKLTYIKAGVDSLKFGFKSENKSAAKNNFWGLAKLKQKSDSSYTGTYFFKTEVTSGNVGFKLEKIWCCGNHTPAHCEDDITKDCKKIQ